MTASERRGLAALAVSLRELAHAVGWLGTLSGNGNAVAFAGSAQRAAQRAVDAFDPATKKKPRTPPAVR